jgi:hypothetical protein
MKTAMQELLDELNLIQLVEKENLFMIEHIIHKCLEKEKEQMIDFAMQMHKIDCSKTGTDLLLDEAQAYYKQTYNQDNSFMNNGTWNTFSI